MSRVTRPPKEVVRDVIEAKVLEPAPWGGRLRQMPVSVMAYFMSKPSAPLHCPTKARSGRAPYDLPQRAPPAPQEHEVQRVGEEQGAQRPSARSAAFCRHYIIRF